MVVVIKRGADRKTIRKAMAKIKPGKGVDTMLYCGILKLKEDPLVIQKKMRDEWKYNYHCKLPDAIVVATSIYLHLPLITADKRLQKIKEASVILYQQSN